MNSRSLIRWANLEERRRREHSAGLQAISGLVLSIFLGLLLAGEIARRLLSASEQDLPAAAVGASHLWMAAATCAYVIGVFGGPFRLYWRRDSKMLSSLSIPGQSLFMLALWRSHRSALQTTLALAIGLLPMGIWADWELPMRHIVLLLIGIAGSAWLGPVAALAAGAIVASDRIQAAITSMGGGFEAPKTSWLGLFPGLSATVVAVALIACAPWALGQPPVGGSLALILGVAIGGPIASLLWAIRRADQVLPSALREVAALDQEILAHIDLSVPSGIERGVFSALLGTHGAQILAQKDASLSRRRYPSPYFVIPCGIVALWIVAASQPTSYLPWGGAILGGILVYAIVMARRSYSPPIEILSLLRTLAVSKHEIQKAKRIQALLRIVIIVVLGGLPLVLRAPELSSASLFVIVACALTVAAAVVPARAVKED